MYQSRPEIKNKKIQIISFLLIVLSVLLFMFTPTASNFSALVQILAISAATTSLFLLIKYIIPDYLYTINDDHLTIHKINKSKSLCVADIPLSSATAAPLALSEYKTFIAENKGYRVYSYIKNPGAKEIVYVPFNVSGTLISLMIEPDNVFLEKLIFAIENTEACPKKEDENE